MRIKYQFGIFLVLLTTMMSHSFAARTEFEWFIGADQWINLPQLKLESYHQISMKKSVKFYEDPTFKGQPAFAVENSFVTFFQTNETCRPNPKSERRVLKKWMYCKPFSCIEKNSQKPVEKQVFTPGDVEWRLDTDTNKLCTKQPEIKVSLIRNGGWESYLILRVENNSAVKLLDKSYYPDLRFCQTEKDSCSFNLKSKDFSMYGLDSTHKKYEPLSKYSKIKNCLEPQVDMQCLQHNSANAKDMRFLNETYSLSGDIPTIKWSPEVIEELRHCLKDSSALTHNTYKGKNMKCMRLMNKILVIDYPEAFISIEPLEYEIVDVKRSVP